MTAIYYPDCTASSPNGRYTLQARSPHNGRAPGLDGKQPTPDEFAGVYHSHQSEFRYRMFENPDRRFLWERRQLKGEDSPHELVLSDDGWSILRTHGFQPEVIAISPAGNEVVRVRVQGPWHENLPTARLGNRPGHDWCAEHLQDTTAGYFWTGHSWRYFCRAGEALLFAWRTAWGQRLVIDLTRATLLSESDQADPVVASALAEEEKRGVARFLADLSGQMSEVRRLLAQMQKGRDVRHPLGEQIQFVTSALHLVGIHRLEGCIPLLREWEEIDCYAYRTGSTAMGGSWWLEAQWFRPILHHSLRLLGQEPRGFPTYQFCDYSTNRTPRFPLPERIPDRRARMGRLTRQMSAEQVLRLLGSPDHIASDGREVGDQYRLGERWEYDSRVDGQWVTLKIVWEEEKNQVRMIELGEEPSYWLRTNDRAVALLCH
jgi:hypothetical protein